MKLMELRIQEIKKDLLADRSYSWVFPIASIQDVPELKTVYACGMNCECLCWVQTAIQPSSSAQAQSCDRGLHATVTQIGTQVWKLSRNHSSGLWGRQETELIDLCSSSFPLSPLEVSRVIKRERSTHGKSPTGTQDCGYCWGS